MHQYNIKIGIFLAFAILLFSSCTTQQKLSYLNNLAETGGVETFTMEIPDYKIQYRDILYISAKTMTPQGTIEDLLQESSGVRGSYIQNEASQYIIGYNVDENGFVYLPVIGKIEVAGNTLEEIRELLQKEVDNYFNNTYVECKLLSFKFTVLGEARAPGTYVNYNNYLTVLEAIGRAGGVGDYGRRDRVLVVRPTEEGSKTYSINLQDKNLLTSEAYFIHPNDVVIIEPVRHKIFNMNLPTLSFILTSMTSALTTTLLLINFLNNK